MNSYFQVIAQYTKHTKNIFTPNSQDLKLELINPFHATGPFLQPLKTSKNFRSCDVFSGYRGRDQWHEEGYRELLFLHTLIKSFWLLIYQGKYTLTNFILIQLFYSSQLLVLHLLMKNFPNTQKPRASQERCAIASACAHTLCLQIKHLTTCFTT